MIRYIPALLSLFALILVSGCGGGMAVGAGATAGVAAASEGGISSAATDVAIQAQINDLWFRKSTDIFGKLDLTVSEGRVLITGVVQDPEHRVEAVRLAWQPKGVKQVINEIKVAKSEGAQGFIRDNWITTQLRTKLTFDKRVMSINYSIDTVQATVYLMGNAKSRAELDRVIEIARTVKGVKGVVSYVKMAGEKVVAAGSAAAQPAAAGSPQYAAPSLQAVPVAPVETIEREQIAP